MTASPDVILRVQRLFPVSDGATWDAFLDLRPDSEPFAPVLVDGLDAMSKGILRHPLLRADAASVALAFWLRKASLGRLVAAFAERQTGSPERLLVPAGRVFHVAPANVDTLFVYSWALAFAAGNASVVRLSQRRTPVVEALLAVLAEVAVGHPELATRNRFVTYAHDAEVSGLFSGWCDERVIWGGDDTVQTLRGVPLAPHAGERAFASKFSYAAVDAAAYLAMNDEKRSKVAAGFFNDLFWFGQQACSSPQILFWVGSEADASWARGLFATLLEAETGRRGWSVDAATANERRLTAFDLALRADVTVDLSRAAFVDVGASGLGALDKTSCAGGLVRHVHVARLDDVVPLIDAGDQTLAHAGFTPETLRTFARRAGSRGLDRVVPIGQALAFEPTWDGFDVLADVTRVVTCRA
ncbi:MAG: hypothetical protein RL199_2067 [Pseudomonadota bacterium]|jgi:hypothetical protein